MKLAFPQNSSVVVSFPEGKLPEPLAEGILKRVSREGGQLFLNGLSTEERIRLHFITQGHYTVNVDAAKALPLSVEGVSAGDSGHCEIRVAVDSLVKQGLSARLLREGIIDSTVPLQGLDGRVGRQFINRGHDGKVYRVSLGGRTIIEKKPHSPAADVVEWLDLLLMLKEKGFSVPDVFGLHDGRILMEDLGDLTELHVCIEGASNRLGLLLHAAREAGMLHSMRHWLWDSTRAWQVRLNEKGKGELFLVDVGGLRKSNETGWDDTLFCLCAFCGNRREFHSVLNEYLRHAPENSEKVERLRKGGLESAREKYHALLSHLNYC